MIFNFKPQGEMEGHLFRGEGGNTGVKGGTLKSSILIKNEKKFAKNLLHHSLVSFILENTVYLYLHLPFMVLSKIF